MRIVRLARGDEHVVLAGATLFDARPTETWTAKFLSSVGHHLLVALDGDSPIGFVSGVETTHPDKGTEMFLYELSVAESHRNRGVGRPSSKRCESSPATAAATACGWVPRPTTAAAIAAIALPAANRSSPA